MTHHEFHATPVKKYRPILTRHAHDFVSHLTKETIARVPVHLKHMSGANIMEATYGIKVLPEDDPFIELAEAGQEAVSKCAIGFYFVEIFPLLRHVPAWFPGAGFQRQAAVWHEAATRQLHVPYADYVRREELGKADECMAKALAEAYGTDDVAVRHAKMATATMYMGGVETVAAVMHTFFLTMLLYPDVQARARRELEAVVGTHRLPTFDDLGAVPYIDALIKEVLRWAPIVRLDLPRRLREGDVYNGYYLEKDSIVIVNIWSILHDDKMYPDPHAFTPERFLNDDGKLNTDILDPQDVAFGFGRRMCPGRFMAYETLWIAIATLLSCAEIYPAKDGQGREIEVKEDFVSAFVT
ncbi:cytochrome P450 [Ganoderma sinense ZZ0214-1]|uniref:Cytochrome P450 n=1 Tax=Ganoderma sinense ZZ0214-1 TaxID=1077348 RepID=A0A2G8RW25_9APHY|nr:cytochrome P450 [Ganoderma sinense ZZ0214-1]